MQDQPIIAAVDLGSNSFRLQLARVENDQLYMLDDIREPVRLAAGLNENNILDEAAILRAQQALARFAERLRGLPPEAVRAVATNTFRIAKNVSQFLPQLEKILAYPIDVIAGVEEARLIYLGVAHGLPNSEHNRLVIDIGGGSTEFIIGNKFTPLKMESLHMGCVSFSCRFFPDGKVNRINLRQAELAACMELQTIAEEFKGQWQQVFASSGTAKVLNEILVQEFGEAGITRDGLEKLRQKLLDAGDINKLTLKGLKADRTASLAGGFAIMYAACCELDITLAQPTSTALREGVLHDLWGRAHDNDVRDVTVQRFIKRYHVDQKQAQRVNKLAQLFARQLLEPQHEAEFHLLKCAAELHEIGISVAHNGYHKHSAYILSNAEMPGFSRTEQGRLGLLTLAQRGKLNKVEGRFANERDLLLSLSLRLAILFYRSRRDFKLPKLVLSHQHNNYTLSLSKKWLSQSPLTEAALQTEIQNWKGLALTLIVEAK